MREPLAARSAPGVDMMRAFLRSEAAGGVVLIAATLIALLWSNAKGSGYAALFATRIHLDLGVWRFDGSLVHAVNDGLMTLFFLLVGLEIRREMTTGELSTPAQLAGPAVAATGGMLVPAALFVAFNHGEMANLRGWAVPMATDIAFSLAMLQILGQRVPTALKVFLTALAIIDDLGAILVIAVFYTSDLNAWALGAGVGVWLLMFGLSRAGVRHLGPYLAGGLVLWACVYASGVHGTLAGVALAFAVPQAPVAGEEEGPAHRLEHALTMWVAYLVLPLFGLANAGLRLDDIPARTLVQPLAIGIFAGLLIGKPAGVFLSTWIGARLGWVRLADGLSGAVLFGAAILCGIGFTMSLFIGDLAFVGQPREAEVKLAVFAASFVSAVAGVAVLLFNLPEAPRPGSPGAG
jgi:NhaA family Na+:H+ antiporter